MIEKNIKKLKITALLAVISVLLIDQGSKIWIKTTFRLGETYEIFPWFKLYYIENPGMAFGMQLFGGEVVGKLILSIFRIIAIAFIGYYLTTLIKKQANKFYIIAISFIFAGALGNMIDGAFYDLIFAPIPGDFRTHGFLLGSVVDMLYFPLFNGNFPSWFPEPWANEYFEFFRPIFNVADVAISTGVGIIIVGQKKFFSKEKTNSKKEKLDSDEKNELD